MTGARRACTRRLILGLVLATVGLHACAMTGPRPAMLRVHCNVPEATVLIDDAFAGRVADWSTGRPLGPGFRRVEIRQAGFFTFYGEISPEEGQAVSVNAQLRPEVD